jgi:TonB-linked SusC/RagA family outer membrane protein
MDKFKKRFLYHGIMKYTMIVFMILLVRPSFSTNADFLGNNEVKQPRQTIKVTGRVMDDNGFPIIGCTVIVKEQKGVGVTTDAEGRYAIECFADETLVYSYIGYITREEKASEANNITVILEENVVTLDEVTVVAFGKQKKESVISSISAVRPEELRVPASNLTTAFAGRMAGVISYQRSGEPGLDDAEYFIRGITTFSASGKRDPLILIDGIEMSTADLAWLNVDDIGSFSVMKDANAAAFYGARGANGVILVTTKEGKAEKLSINVRAELSSSSNTELVELADPVTYMKLHNEAVRTRDPMAMLPYSSSKIRETELGTDPLMYPAVDWYDYLIKDHTFNQRVHLNLTGGGQAVQYYLSANYQHDTGILKESEDNFFDNNININQMQVRSNVTIKLAPRTTAVVCAYGQFDDTTSPGYTGAKVFDMARNATLVQFLPYYPPDEANKFSKHILFGMGSELGSYTNPLAAILSRYRQQSRSMMLIQMEMDHQFTGVLGGLFAKGVFNVKREAYYGMDRGYNPFYYHPATTVDGSYQLIALNPESGTEYLDFQGGSRDITSTLYGECRLGYNKIFNEVHDINALLVGTIRDESGMTGADNNLYTTLPRRNLALAGRLAYGYDTRYFTEFNFGYNGSERFAKNHRFGFFPSVGVGWLI